jgi:hypothetical protein
MKWSRGLALNDNFFRDGWYFMGNWHVGSIWGRNVSHVSARTLAIAALTAPPGVMPK